MGATLNAEQLSAVNSNAKKLLCLAGAGTGKTFCMISRIKRLVDEGVDPTSMLVLTFTNAAAFEMKARYQKGMSLGARIPEFRTFHSFCYSILATDKEVRSKLGYTVVPRIADERTTKKIESNAKLQCGIKLSDKQLKGKAVLSMKEQAELALYRKAVYRSMKIENVITFDMLCYDICQLFVDDDPTVLKYKSRYKYIFVDEFQDTDPKQHKFISSFEDATLFVVGDALQAIYSFRGADSSIIKSLAEDDEWEVVKLYRNYRSTKNICDFANSNSRYAANSAHRIQIASDRLGDDVDVTNILEQHNPCSRGEINTKTLGMVSEWLLDVEGTTAILSRTNAEVECMVAHLNKLGIKHSTGKRNADVVHMLKSSLDDSYFADWLSTYLNADWYADYLRFCAIMDDTPPIAILLDKFINCRAVSIRTTPVMEIRRALKSDEPKIAKAAKILDILDVSVEIDESELSMNTASEFIDHLISRITEDIDSDLYVGTIHSSKGLEYDNVILVGVNDTSFKLTNEENNNLYYVGITRAKNYLWVFKASWGG